MTLKMGYELYKERAQRNIFAHLIFFERLVIDTERHWKKISLPWSLRFSDSL